MIIWLASYPKSGNTWVRSFIVSLLYSKDNKANLNNLSFIPQYPLRSHFKNLVNDIDDFKEISSNWLKSQSIINSDKKIKFLKTHHALCSVNGSVFTNYENSLGVIYIVRDPRNIVSSILYHFSKKNYSEARDFLLNENKALWKKFDKYSPTINKDMLTQISSWKNNYNSWKHFKKNYLLIKYENLISNPDKEFRKISRYISNLMGLNFDEEKVDSAIKSNIFENLQKLENENGFAEAISNEKTGKPKSFFNLGPKNKWEDILDVQIKESIEEEFKLEMKQLGYLK